MNVSVIAHTRLAPIYGEGPPFAIDDWMDYNIEGTEADNVAEFIGRAQSLSFDRPHPATANNRAFLGEAIRQGNMSIFEHVSITLYVEGASRAMIAELSLHRRLSISTLSHGELDADHVGVVMPPVLESLADSDADQAAAIVHEQDVHARAAYERLMTLLVRNGLDRSTARQTAHSILPNSTEAPVVVTATVRAWRDLMWSAHSTSQGSELASFCAEVENALSGIAPNSVQDLAGRAPGFPR
ncbi:thymidylate synthase (FAD) [Actinokineospora baliensis]|uniref:FAD-dependent thymidylate synthase n=1 Tax=Actinokineospora baliensis TaxID=547056 RepID=UPI00195E8204|nr:FAD-dependent thymidylate synthase [Actinokineospora baliensis]MBM7771939.1 thymidylate synthase (FAD) [Actinokineospora baliensis]